MFSRKLVSLWIFSNYETLSLKFFECRLLAFNAFSDFPVLSKTAQNIAIQLLDLHISAIRPHSTSQDFFLGDPDKRDRLRTNLQSNVSIPFSRTIDETPENRLLCSDNLSLIAESARESLLLFQLLYTQNPDKLFGKELLRLMMHLSRVCAPVAVDALDQAQTLLFDRVEYLLQNSQVFSLADLFEFLKLVFSESQNRPMGLPQSVLDSFCDFCLSKLETRTSSKFASALAKEVFDFISFLSKTGDHAKLLSVIRVFMIKFSRVDISGNLIDGHHLVSPQTAPRTCPKPVSVLSSRPFSYFWKNASSADVLDNEHSPMGSTQKCPSVLSDYIAQLESILKEFLKSSQENICNHFQDILAIFSAFSFNCLGTDTMVLRNLHKILQKESKMDLLSLAVSPSNPQIRDEKILFAQYFLDVCAAVLKNGQFSQGNPQEFHRVMSSIFGQR